MWYGMKAGVATSKAFNATRHKQLTRLAPYSLKE